MKILVTGGAGFIGSNVSDVLVKDGHEVTVLGHTCGNPLITLLYSFSFSPMNHSFER